VTVLGSVKGVLGECLPDKVPSSHWAKFMKEGECLGAKLLG
jgi:hypothetical protein